MKRERRSRAILPRFVRSLIAFERKSHADCESKGALPSIKPQGPPPKPSAGCADVSFRERCGAHLPERRPSCSRSTTLFVQHLGTTGSVFDCIGLTATTTRNTTERPDQRADRFLLTSTTDVPFRLLNRNTKCFPRFYPQRRRQFLQFRDCSWQAPSCLAEGIVQPPLRLL